MQRDRTKDDAQRAREKAGFERVGDMMAAARWNLQRQAKDLRDRAFAHLDELVSDLREAGRYAFRKDPARKKHFGSAYRRRHRAHKRVSPPTPTPTDGPS